MTDPTPLRPTRPLRGIPADEMGDVLASIRRLIAQDGSPRPATHAPARGVDADTPAVSAAPDALTAAPRPVAEIPDMAPPSRDADPHRSAHRADAAATITAAPHLVAVPSAPENAPPPLRLRPEALIPPAELPQHMQGGRLRLTAASAVVEPDHTGAAGETSRMAAIIRAATAARHDAGLAAGTGTPAHRPSHDGAGSAPTPQPATAAGFHPAMLSPSTPAGVTETGPTSAPTAACAADPGAERQAEGLDQPATSAAAPPCSIMQCPATTQPVAPSEPPSAASGRLAPFSAARNLARIEAAATRPADDPDSTALHLFAPADEDVPNGSLLRGLLREAIRQELQGEMGARFSRNLRQIIRQEVALAMETALQGDL